MWPRLPAADLVVSPSVATDTSCPICGGALDGQREQLQCVRCRYVFCQNCEGGAAHGSDEELAGW